MDVALRFLAGRALDKLFQRRRAECCDSQNLCLAAFEHRTAVGPREYPDRDIKGITVNRWSHGYAYSPGLLWEPDYPSEESKPWVIGRKPFGRITIANSDSGARADTNSAITEAFRAVQEALRG